MGIQRDIDPVETTGEICMMKIRLTKTVILLRKIPVLRFMMPKMITTPTMNLMDTNKIKLL